MISVQCGCGTRFEVDERFAGRPARCPNCQAQVDVPDGTSHAAAEAPSPAPAPSPLPPFGDAPRPSIRPPTKLWIILFAALGLATILVPWNFAGSFAEGVTSVTFSWEILDASSVPMQRWVLATWAAAFLGLVLAVTLKRWALAVCLAIIGACPLVLAAAVLTEGRTTAHIAETVAWWWPLVLIGGLVLLMASSAARVRVGPSIATRIIQIVGAIAAGVTLGVALVTVTPAYVETVSRLSTDAAARPAVRAAILDSVQMLGAALLALACLLGMLHAVLTTIHSEGPASAVTGLIGGGATMVVVARLARPLIGPHPMRASYVAILCALALVGPVLAGAGLSRLLTLATLAAQRRRSAKDR
ncbi:MAG: hypothetical protein KGY99_02410 [Phycisphaerae bacterium]|nr:hypothetical protein [Phycisphaerae bacterium]